MSSIDELKSQLWLRVALRNASDEKWKDENEKIAKGIEAIPIRKIYDQAIFMQENLLPRIEKSKGKNSAEYEMYKDIFHSLCYAAIAVDRMEMQERRFYLLNAKHEILIEHVAYCEKELSKYIALEDLFFSSSMDVRAKAVAERVEDLMEKEGLLTKKK